MFYLTSGAALLLSRCLPLPSYFYYQIPTETATKAGPPVAIAVTRMQYEAILQIG